MTKTHVTKWGVGWVDNSRKDPGCLENQVPLLFKGAPACANEACFLVPPRPRASLRRPPKLPLKHPQVEKPDVEGKRKPALSGTSNELNGNPWLLGMGVELWGVIASSQFVLML